MPLSLRAARVTPKPAMMPAVPCAGLPTVFWGVIPWPHLPLSKSLHEVAEEAHELLAWTGIALFLLHVAGALRHQFLLRDGLLGRMAPGGKAWVAGVLALLVVVVYFVTGGKIASDVVASGGYDRPAPAPSAAPMPNVGETMRVRRKGTAGPASPAACRANAGLKAQSGPMGNVPPPTACPCAIGREPKVAALILRLRA